MSNFDIQVSAAVAAIAKGGVPAAKLFRNEFDPVTKAAVRADPDGALALVRNVRMSDGGLSRGIRVRVLETVVGEHTDARSAELLAQKVEVSHLAELLLAQGDLPSAAFAVASKEAVLMALLMDVMDDSPALYAEVMTRLLCWGGKLSERADFDELLETEISSDVTLRQLLLSAVSALSEDGSLDAALENLGLGEDEGVLAEMQELADNGGFIEVDEDLMRVASAKLRELARQTKKEATSFEAVEQEVPVEVDY
ncbi:MAG: hypothetical protein Q8P30_03210 [Candidatus Uhrbacteria bacterium]|nr:hypothetical protein [Candidatus Uhrbacteria bacterium]